MESVLSKKEPLIHITKRTDIKQSRAILIRAVAILLGLLLSGIVIMLLTGLNPLDAYKTMLEGSVGSNRKIWATIQNTAILLIIALAITPAFKMRFWNLGAEGQVLIGGLATASCMIYLGDVLPAPILIPVMFLAALAAGLVWAGITAFFRAKWETNETLFTLMMNYVAMQLVSFFVVLWESPKNSGKIGLINPDSEAGWLPTLFDQKYLLNVLIVVVVLVFIYFYLKYSKHGYEIAVVGESPKTAHYVGINVPKVIMRTVALSGALCGIAGFLLVAGTDHTISMATAGGQGFIAVMVSWLAKFDPLWMILPSFLLVFLQRGAREIAMTFRLNDSIADIITGIVILFIIGSEFFIHYEIHFRKKKGDEA